MPPLMTITLYSSEYSDGSFGRIESHKGAPCICYAYLFTETGCRLYSSAERLTREGMNILIRRLRRKAIVLGLSLVAEAETQFAPKP